MFIKIYIVAVLVYFSAIIIHSCLDLFCLSQIKNDIKNFRQTYLNPYELGFYIRKCWNRYQLNLIGLNKLFIFSGLLIGVGVFLTSNFYIFLFLVLVFVAFSILYYCNRVVLNSIDYIMYINEEKCKELINNDLNDRK